MAIEKHFTINQARTLQVYFGRCATPTFAVTGCEIVATPKFFKTYNINNVYHNLLDPLLSVAPPLTISSDGVFVSGGATALRTAVVVSGTWNAAQNSATFNIPFGSQFNVFKKEYEQGSTPSLYSYSANIKTTGDAVAETFATGTIRVAINTSAGGGGVSPVSGAAKCGIYESWG